MRGGSISSSLFDRENDVRRPDDRLRDVAHRDATWGRAGQRTVVGVAVQHQIGAGAVDGLAQERVAQERVEIEPLAVERVRDGE